MNKIKYLLFITVLSVIAGCSDNEFLGDTNPNGTEQGTFGAILFNSGFKAMTRGDGDIYHADAADLLGNKFIVNGVKGAGAADDGSDMTAVFNNYTVDYTQNTSGGSVSAPSGWEYVGKTHLFNFVGEQSIKYWDFSATAYDFVAYSTGKGNTMTIKTASDITEGDAPSANAVYATPIDYANATTAAYKLRGAAADLAKCYFTDMKTVAHDGFDKEVSLHFRSVGAKVRMAIYENIPGYSVKDVKFYSADQAPTINPVASSTAATLFGADAFCTGGTCTVSFPTIGSGNSDDKDYNKAQLTIAGAGTRDTQTFGTLNYTGRERNETAGNLYLGRTSNTATFAGTGTYYQDVLPNETSTVLEMCADYTLVSIDRSGEEIKVHGAKAFIPAIYTKWVPNYAYTYIFKISDNTNGWTNPANAHHAGLYPITLDAVILDSEEEDGQQTTITTVSTPSITTYQKGYVYNVRDEYKLPTVSTEDDDDIYVMVMTDGTPVADLSDEKSLFYKLTGAPGQTYEAEPASWPIGYYTDAACTTEASGTFSSATTYYTKDLWTETNVMEALNIRESESTSEGVTTITGRNELALTPTAIDNTVTTIPGEDGKTTTVAAGKAAKVTPTTAGTYVYVYQVSSGTSAPVMTAMVLSAAPSDWVASTENRYYSDAEGQHQIITDFANPSVTLTAQPTDWNVTDNVYYSDEACTTAINSAYADLHVFDLTEEPADWATGGYYTNDECTEVPAEFVAGTYYKKVTCYKKLVCYKMYTNLNNAYAVKVIKVVEK